MSESTTIRWEQDADGVVILTLDDPNQSANTMNAAYEASMAATVDAAGGREGRRSRRDHHLGQEDLLRRRRPQRPQARHARGRRRDRRGRSARSRPSCARWRRSASRWSPRSTAPRSAAAWRSASPATTGSPSTTRRSSSASPRSARPAAGRRRRRPHRADARDRRGADAAAAAGPASCARARRRRSGSSTRSSRPGGADPGGQGVDRGQPRGAAAVGRRRGYKIPGGTPATPGVGANLPAFPANLRKQLKGANYPAPHHILAAAVEGAQVDFDNAIEIEGRYFVDLVDRPGRQEHDPGVLLRPAARSTAIARPPDGRRAVRSRRRSSCSARA